MKRVCFLSVILSASAVAASIGSCVTGSFKSYIGNPCALGDKVFDNFAYSGNEAAMNVGIHYATMGTGFHMILAPSIWAGLFTSPSLTDRTTAMPVPAPNVPALNYQIAGKKDQADFDTEPGSSGFFNVVNPPDLTSNFVAGSETGDPRSSAGVTTVPTVSTLTDPGGSDDPNPGSASLELAAVVPEPATLSLIGIALLAGGLLRRRAILLR